MASVVFENGVTVEFDGEPTPQDIEEVASQFTPAAAIELPEQPTFVQEPQPQPIAEPAVGQTRPASLAPLGTAPQAWPQNSDFPRTGAIQNSDRTISTHKMAWGSDQKGFYAFPTIIEENGQLRELPMREADLYAHKTGKIKRFATQKEAEDYAAGSWKEPSQITPDMARNYLNTDLMAQARVGKLPLLDQKLTQKAKPVDLPENLMSDYDRKVIEMTQAIAKMPPVLREITGNLRNVSDLFGWQSKLSEYGLDVNRLIGRDPQTLAIIRDAFEKYNSDIGSEPTPEQRLGRLATSAAKIGAEFALLPEASAPAKFALHAMAQAPQRGETALERAKAVGESAITGKVVGLAGKHIKDILVRAPILSTAFGLKTYLQGGDKWQIAESAAFPLMFEAAGLLKGGRPKEAVAMVRQTGKIPENVSDDVIIREIRELAEYDLATPEQRMAELPQARPELNLERNKQIQQNLDDAAYQRQLDQIYSGEYGQKPPTPAQDARSAKKAPDGQPVADTPIESRAGQEKTTVSESRIAEYEKKNPDIVSVDEAKKVIPAYDVSKGKELEFQQEGGDIAKAVYDRYLQSKKGVGNNTILFTAGGTGSGKSTLLKGAKGHTFAVDGTFAYKPHAIEQINKALENGYDVDVRYVYRDPIEAWKGIWNRYLEGGHFVPADVFYSTHVEAARNVAEIAKLYGGKINVEVYENVTGGNPRKITIDNLVKKVFNFKKIQEQVNEISRKQLEQHPEAQTVEGASLTTDYTNWSGGSGEGRQGTQSKTSGGTGQTGTHQLTQVDTPEIRLKNPDNFRKGFAYNPIPDMVEAGRKIYESGKTKAIEWAKAMRDAFGRHIMPYLREAWIKMREFLNEDDRVPENVRQEVAQLASLIKSAKPVKAETEKLKSQELGKRTAVMAGMQKQQGESSRQVLLNSFKALSGELPVAEFEPPQNKMTAQAQEKLFAHINNSDLRPLEKGNLAVALDKILSGKNPQEAEIAKLEQFFGKPIVKALRSRRPIGDKIGEFAENVWNFPKALKSGLDMSAVGRQGLVLGTRHPIMAYRAFIKQLGAARPGKRGAEVAKQVHDQIYNDPIYEKSRKAGLYLMPWDAETTKLNEMEEAFQTSWAHKVPGLKVSERVFATYLNKLRFDVFKDFVKRYPDLPDDAYKSFAKQVNIFSGRGSLGKAESAGHILNLFMFSSRLTAARLETPFTVFAKNPQARAEAIKSIALTLGAGLSLMGLAYMAGAQVTLNPYSSDFGKIRIGKTTYDVWGGFSQYARFVFQLYKGRRKNANGKTVKANRYETVMRFARTKASPSLGLSIDLLKGTDFVGNKVNLNTTEGAKQAIRNIASPLIIDGVIEQLDEEGFGANTIGSFALPFIGVGVNTYTPRTRPKSFDDNIFKNTSSDKLFENVFK